MVPSPTPTATSTAVPVTISGSPRAAVAGAPIANGNAPCGVVDLFDFPLDPPDAQSARGGGDFGIWRNRYQKFHAGEDWRAVNGDNFGQPVYNIGHGLVTYAEPNGWGRDKGVVIIQHTFADGSSLLSFYGHLDPPSVTLKPGLCVTRGQQIGKIGRPRTSPHLHFEIRTHLPYQTGTGYWAEDPTQEGWLPPSLTIWQKRIASSPGILWAKSITGPAVKSLGLTDDQVLVAQAGDSLLGIDIKSGETNWEYAIPQGNDAFLLDSSRPILYTAGQLGTVEAFRLPANLEENGQAAGQQELESLWTVDLDLVGQPQLLPLPAGGLLSTYWDKSVAISPEGDLYWPPIEGIRPNDWVDYEDQLIISSMGNGRSLYTITAKGPIQWPEELSGILKTHGEQILLYNQDGLFQLNPETLTAEQRIKLPGIRPDLADMIVLSDGSILISHMDQADRRLILLDQNGAIIWQRSIKPLGLGQTKFLEINGLPILILQDVQNDLLNIKVYIVDGLSGDLTLVFEGGSRSAASQNNDFRALTDNQLMINVGGQIITVLDLLAAEDGIVPAVSDTNE